LARRGLLFNIRRVSSRLRVSQRR